MFIERLKLNNFKSFGGSHELVFAPGYTAIVGPNGSGKSNILDGLRWSLGESSAGRLRISRQADLIFQGSAGMNEADEAEVSLHLADGDRRSVLKRRIDASGAAMFLDAVRSRMQDLPEFKVSWNLGGDRFAFIGQGEITDAISLRPFQRRLQLEELFGIDQYRRKRDEAHKEMDQTTDELLRLQTLQQELQNRREEIAPELEKAVKAQEYQQRLDENRAALYHHRRHLEERRQAKLERDNARETLRLVSAQWWSRSWEGALQSRREQGSDYLRQRSELQQRINDLSPQLDHVQAAEVELEGRWRENLFAKERLDEDRRLGEEELKELETRRGEQAVLVGRLSGELEHLKGQRDDLLDRQNKECEAATQRRDRRQSLTEQVSALQEQRLAALARQESLHSQDKDVYQRLKELNKDKSRAIDELTAQDEVLEKLEDRLDQAETKYDSVAQQSQELQMRDQALRRSIARAEAELDHLIQSSQDSLYPKPVQMVLSAAKLGRLDIEVLPLVEAFRCGETVASALEAYLGGRQFWLLTDSLSSAQKGIELLKERSGGRATFLPLERCRPRSATLSKRGGVVGWAMDLIEAESRWKPALQHVMGDLLVVEDYKTGAALSSGARFPVVTLDGEVFSPGGTVSGGRSARSGGALSVRRQIDELERQGETDRASQKEVAETLVKSAKAEEKARAALEELRQQAAGQREKVEHCRQILQGVQSELTLLEAQRNQSLQRGSHCEAELAALDAQIEGATAELSELAISSDDDALSERIAGLSTESLLLEERLGGHRRELEGFVRQVMDLQSRLFKTSESTKTVEQRLVEAEQQRNETAQRKSELQGRVDKLQQQVSALEAANSQAAARAERLFRRVQQAGEALELWREKSLTSRQELEKSKGRCEEMIAAFEETWPYPEGFVPGDESLEKIEGVCRYCDRALKELGPVRSGTVDEDRSLCERLSFLDEQIGDVKTAMSELKDVIAGADQQAGQLFADALLRIDRRFDQLFQRLFGGGEGHLTWQNRESTWDSGVEIVARPPGKKPLFLAQLSGGEQTLTALALLFASMETAEVPLAVLDEVDAALDEVNLSRFASMVTEYSDRVQLIVMTHRRQTMERAETMYGVTMSEPGLSQIVSVKVDQWS